MIFRAVFAITHNSLTQNSYLVSDVCYPDECDFCQEFLFVECRFL